MGKSCSKDVTASSTQDKYAMQKTIPKIISLPDEKFLYVILPYFNYCNFHRRTQLFLEFIARIKENPVVRIVVVEASSPEYDFLLPRKIPGVYKHIGFKCKDHVWIKENLINLAVKQLPRMWRYMAWVDADITFLNTSWADDTIYALTHKYDVAQIYQTCVNMGPENEALKIDRSFGYMYRESGHPYHKAAKYGFWHPGFAWACSRRAYEQMGGLIDFGILGSGDRHMALALIGLVDISHPGNIHENYKKHLLWFQQQAKGLELGWIPGTILHHWHGRLEDRKYQERWNILTKGEYDPDTDIVRSKDGLIELTEKGKRLSEQLTNYFIGRREDNMSMS